MIAKDLSKFSLPHKSGVYIFKDKKRLVLYVGKAVDLYHRVTSYFGKDVPLKTASLVERTRSVETIVVESELEALILEANLIKKFLPPYNVRLTDAKDYLYIGITKDDFPKIITLRKQDLKKVKKFFGPFPSARTIRNTLKMLRKVFPWCSNPPRENKIASSPSAPRNDVIASTFASLSVNSAKQSNRRLRACFYYHLGLCPGACVGLISKEEYQKNIKRFTKFLEGKKEELVWELVREMEKASDQQKFEEAARVKKIVDGVSYLTQPNRVQAYLENPNFLQQESQLALRELQKDLNLPKIPGRIEGYDISNIQGKQATGSMVVLTDGEIDKSQYRKFKIRISGRPNDVGMMREIISRRLKHQDWSKPDLILVDGGRGQARAVKFQIPSSKFQVPIFGLAKKMEWIYPPEGEIIKLPKRSLSLKLLQKLRDEAHRFAITYHRKLRDIIINK